MEAAIVACLIGRRCRGPHQDSGIATTADLLVRVNAYGQFTYRLIPLSRCCPTLPGSVQLVMEANAAGQEHRVAIRVDQVAHISGSSPTEAPRSPSAMIAVCRGE